MPAFLHSFFAEVIAVHFGELDPCPSPSQPVIVKLFLGLGASASSLAGPLAFFTRSHIYRSPQQYRGNICRRVVGIGIYGQDAEHVEGYPLRLFL